MRLLMAPKVFCKVKPFAAKLTSVGQIFFTLVTSRVMSSVTIAVKRFAAVRELTKISSFICWHSLSLLTRGDTIHRANAAIIGVGRGIASVVLGLRSPSFHDPCTKTCKLASHVDLEGLGPALETWDVAVAEVLAEVLLSIEHLKGLGPATRNQKDQLAEIQAETLPSVCFRGRRGICALSLCKSILPSNSFIQPYLNSRAPARMSRRMLELVYDLVCNHDLIGPRRNASRSCLRVLYVTTSSSSVSQLSQVSCTAIVAIWWEFSNIETKLEYATDSQFPQCPSGSFKHSSQPLKRKVISTRSRIFKEGKAVVREAR